VRDDDEAVQRQEERREEGEGGKRRRGERKKRAKSDSFSFFPLISFLFSWVYNGHQFNDSFIVLSNYREIERGYNITKVLLCTNS
jgi:hypothetical protein